MSGKGTYMWFDGKTYTGDFLDGCIHGFGVLVLSDGSKYEG
jgi:hypothetical protein